MKTGNSISTIRARVFLGFLAITLLASAVSMAETKFWTGGGENANVSNPDNWSGGSPADGDAWEFGAVGSSGYMIINDYGSGTSNSGITFTEQATGTYTIAPNWTRQTGDIVNNSSFPQNVFLGHELHNNITINAANENINIAQNNTINLNYHNLTIDGNHDTSLAIHLGGTGTVTINQGAALQVSAGIADSVQSVTINQGGALRFANHDTFGNHLSQSPVQIIADGGMVCNAPGWFTTINHLTLKNGGDLIDNTGHDGWLSFQLVNEFNVTADSTLAANQISTIAIGTEGAYNGVIPYGVNFNVADVTRDASTDLLVSARLRDGGRRNEGGGNFTKSGAGTMELTNVNEITGNVTISDGILKLSGNGTIGYGSVINNATLEFAYESDQTFGNFITDTGALIKNGSETLELTNRNDFTGNIVINEGVLKASIGILDGAPVAGGALGDADVAGRTITVNSGATLEFAAINVLGNAGSFDFKTRVIADGGTIRNAPNVDGQPYNSFVLLNNPEFKNGATLIDNGGFNDWHSYTLNGEVTISADDPTKGSANQVQFLVGTGEVVNDGIFPNGVNFNVADVTGDDSTDLLVSTRFRGTPQNIAGSFTKTGAGTMELTNVNEITGNVTISDGILKLSGNGAIGYGSVIDNATLEFAYESDQPFANAISGAGNVVKSGNGTLTLTQAPGYTGSTSVESGTLALAQGGTLHNLSGGKLNDDGSVAIAAAVDASGKELTIDNAVMKTFVGSIKAQSILKTGYGTLKIYADEQNKVVADTFTVTDSELDFKGYFEGSLEVINGAFFSPGNSIGEANITGNVAFITNTADSNGFAYFEFGDFTGADENHDLLVLSASSLFNANDEAGVVLLDFANDDAADWASAGVDYLLVKNGAFENGKDYTSWLTPTLTDLFGLEGRADGLYLIGLAGPGPEPGSGVPEPSTWALLILGVAGLLFIRKKK